MSERAPRLLVVDDDATNRNLLARRLRHDGFEVVGAGDGVAALESIERADPPYDLVILDVMMPRMDGFETLKHVRERFDQTELPVLMATAKADADDVVGALDQGANDYVTKPYDVQVLIARIRVLVATRRKAARPESQITRLPRTGSVTPGTVLGGRYEVMETLGEGGFARVFKAKQLSTGQIVAVKVLRTLHPEVEAIQRVRFEREMKVIGKLRHPHVVELIDFGQLKARIEATQRWSEAPERAAAKARPPSDEGESRTTTTGGGGDGASASAEPTERPTTETGPSVEPDPSSRPTAETEPSPIGVEQARIATHPKPSLTPHYELPYIVMEFLDGLTLSRYITRHAPLSAEDAVEIMLPVVHAVAIAHQAGVVHRDLKPPNVVITRSVDGRPHPKVLDFGISVPADEDFARLTDDGEFVGTPEYMAPEQLAGVGEADRVSDQYSLGVMLYECLCGQRAFRGASLVDLVQRVSAGDFTRPRVHVPDVPAALEEIVLRAMALEPEERFPSTLEFGCALLPFASAAVRERWEKVFAEPSDQARISDVDSSEALTRRLSLEVATLDGDVAEIVRARESQRPPTDGDPDAAEAATRAGRRNSLVTPLSGGVASPEVDDVPPPAAAEEFEGTGPTKVDRDVGSNSRILQVAYLLGAVGLLLAIAAAVVVSTR